MRASKIEDLLCIVAGGLLVTAGAWMIHRPSGCIVAGLLLIVNAIAGGRQRPRVPAKTR